MTNDEVIRNEGRFIVPTYVRPDVVFSHGQGVHLFDTDGRRYLDFMAGIAVMALGHGDPEWMEAVCQQASKLTHVSNLFHTEAHVDLARRLIENSFADRVFFCNSGSEANETALKFARKVGRTVGGNGDREEKTKIVAFTGSFHGRTMGALAATARAKYREPFAPLVQDVVFAEFNDVEEARAVVDNKTCAVIVEPVQGEGGVNPADPGFLRSLRVLCNEHNALLIFDEIQCGMGRTGTLWAHEADGVKPDIMTLAKPLAGGLPIGATLVTEEVAAVMKPGDHGSTFAAGPLVCRAAQVVFDRLQRPGFLAMVRENGAYLLQLLADIKSPLIEESRGRGLLVGVQLNRPVKPLLAAARERGLLVINAGDTVLRLCPPLIVERPHIDQAVEILKECLADMEERA